MRKRMGPRTEPCATPDVTGMVADFSLSITRSGSDQIKMPGSI